MTTWNALEQVATAHARHLQQAYVDWQAHQAGNMHPPFAWWRIVQQVLRMRLASTSCSNAFLRCAMTCG